MDRLMGMPSVELQVLILKRKQDIILGLACCDQSKYGKVQEKKSH